MNYRKLMSQPANAKVAYQLESLILRKDQAMQQQGITLKDSDVKSAIVKAVGMIRRKPPKKKPENDLERGIMALAHELAGGWEMVELEEEDDDSLAEENEKKRRVSLILEAIKDSVNTRREMYGHARGYLDYLPRFLKSGEGI